LGKPEQQRFAMGSGVLTSINSRQRSAINGSPLSVAEQVIAWKESSSK